MTHVRATTWQAGCETERADNAGRLRVALSLRPGSWQTNGTGRRRVNLWRHGHACARALLGPVLRMSMLVFAWVASARTHINRHRQIPRAPCRLSNLHHALLPTARPALMRKGGYSEIDIDATGNVVRR
jgi:hypothetical protein